MELLKSHEQTLLNILFKRPEGLSMDEITMRVGASRPAVRRYLVAMKRLGYIEVDGVFATKGRPGQRYKLTTKGLELYPRQYSLFGGALLKSLKGEIGEGGLKDLMRRLGREVGRDAKAAVAAPQLTERIHKTAALMNQLAYDAESKFTGYEPAGAPPIIEAKNCVYHAFATQMPEVCEFDSALLTELTGAQVSQEECIVRGGTCCRFRFTENRKA